MITELTDAQQNKFEETVEKWVRIGFDTTPLDEDKVRRAVDLMYHGGGLDAPQRIVYCTSPVAMYLAAEALKRSEATKVEDLIRELVPNTVLDSARETIRELVTESESDSLRSSVRDSLQRTLREAVELQVRESVIPEVSTPILNLVEDSVLSPAVSSVQNSIGGAVWNAVQVSVVDFVEGSNDIASAATLESPIFGQHEAWLSIYDYYREVVGLKSETDKFIGLIECAKECGWLYPTRDICFVSEKPTEINVSADGRLSSEIGAAILYSDGWGLCYLNGVRVPVEIAVTPAAELSVDLVLTVENAQVRSEIVKKIGLERVMKELNAECLEVSSNGMYELLLLDLRDGRRRPFLKMLNPSTFEYHIEGVHPLCGTITEALNWRNGERIWDENGAEWQQQGDVLMFPLGVESYKPFPKIIT